MADIFISYAAEDRPRIEPLAKAFETAGLSVWWDRRIGTGSSFDVVIERELDTAGCVVVVWSKHSIGSEWVRNEAAEGAERGVLVPLQIDDVRPPLAFRRRQTAQLLDWPNGSHAESLREVIDSVRRFLAGSSVASSHRATAPPPVERQPIVVAVLPLRDRTAEHDMGYLCEGLAEDLMNALFPIEGLRVLSATDTFAFKDSQSGTREIGASLGATVVLEGSVQRAGDRIAVSVRLVNVGDGVTICSERLQRSADDIFEVQSEIAGRVVDGLRAKLGLAGTAAPYTDTRPRDPTAFAVYKTVDDPSDLASSVVRGAIVHLRRTIALECVIALDPSLDRAYADLIRCYLGSHIAVQPAYAKANAVLAQLQLRNPDSPLVWEMGAELESNMANLADRCHPMIVRGERMYPYAHPTGLQDVRGVYGRALAHAGLHREAFGYLTLIDRPQEPNYLSNLVHACGCLVACGEFDQALAMCRRVQAASPTAYFVAATWELIVHLASGALDNALSVQPDEDSWREPFALPLLRATQSGSHIEDAAAGASYFHTELRGYALLAIDDVERGIEHLQRGIADAGLERHWIGFRLPIFSVLFSERVKQHPGYRKALAMANLDEGSREPIRAQAATLTPITGVEVGPLLPL